jgi:predicted Zn-dependent protease
MSSVPPVIQRALDLARSGDIDSAIGAAQVAVASHPDDHGLRLFIGLLHSRRLELDQALPHVRKAVSLAPADPIARVELVRLLIGLGRLDEAERELDGVRLPGLEPLRLKAMIFARRDQPGQAAQMFQQIVAAHPRDHESWVALARPCSPSADRGRRPKPSRGPWSFAPTCRNSARNCSKRKSRWARARKR